MDALKQKMVKMATEKYGQILSVRDDLTFAESFTEEEGMLIFWFNDVKNSTHIVTSEMVS